jgi:hypothetical protein
MISAANVQKIRRSPQPTRNTLQLTTDTVGWVGEGWGAVALGALGGKMRSIDHIRKMKEKDATAINPPRT